MKNHMEEEIKTILANQFGIDPSNILNGQCLNNDLHADSIDVIEIIMSIEREFGIVIQTDEFTSTTVQFLLDLTAKKLSVKEIDQ